MNNSKSRFNRAIKRWPGWLLLAVVATTLFAIGIGGGGGVNDPSERADALAQRVACPVCDGESVFESRNRASINLRNEISTLVNEGRLSDDEILARIQAAYPADILLLPPSDGFNAVVWVLPAAVAICAAAGLVVAFRRWRRTASTLEPSAEDRAVVASALATGDADDR
jgi:cytochrome c-type biogenesis protein CcmH